MHCPKCGQQQISEETRFCSRCGFLLTGIAQVISNEGAIPSANSAFFAADSPRRRGVKQGAFVFLLSFLIVPLAAILALALRMDEPFLPALSAIILTVGGLLRIVYALMFESGNPGGRTLEEDVFVASQGLITNKKGAAKLPAAQSIPVNTYAPPATGNWRDTNDLAVPGSVTDSTTKLLTKEEEGQ